MTWLKVDDGVANHPKMQAAVTAAEKAVPGRGAHVMALWMAAGSLCAKANAEGVVSELMLAEAAFHSKADVELVAPALVKAGLWHDARSLKRCERCSRRQGKLPRDAYYFHDWLVYNFTKAESTDDDHDRRDRALRKNKALCHAIKDRDRNHCRYCGRWCDWKDRRSDVRPTYDHRDPHGENSYENVVVACNACNVAKGERTPEQAGMVLRAVPDRYPLPPWPDLAPELDPNQVRSQESDSLTRDPGRSQIGVGSVPGPERDRLLALTSNGHPNGHGPHTNGDHG